MGHFAGLPSAMYECRHPSDAGSFCPALSGDALGAAEVSGPGLSLRFCRRLTAAPRGSTEGGERRGPMPGQRREGRAAGPRRPLRGAPQALQPSSPAAAAGGAPGTGSPRPSASRAGAAGNFREVSAGKTPEQA